MQYVGGGGGMGTVDFKISIKDQVGGWHISWYLKIVLAKKAKMAQKNTNGYKNIINERKLQTPRGGVDELRY